MLLAFLGYNPINYFNKQKVVLYIELVKVGEAFQTSFNLRSQERIYFIYFWNLDSSIYWWQCEQQKEQEKGETYAMGFIHSSILKPSRVFQRSDHSLYLQVIAKAVNSLFSPMSTHLVPTKRNCSIKYIKAIDPYWPDSQRACQPVGCVDVLSKHTCSQSITTCIRPPYHLIHIPTITKKLNQPSYWYGKTQN